MGPSLRWGDGAASVLLRRRGPPSAMNAACPPASWAVHGPGSRCGEGGGLWRPIMTIFRKIRPLAAAATATALLVAGASPAGAQGRWDWTGGRQGDREYGLAGAGVRLLLPEL